MKEVIKTAPTVDEAIELALKELNLSREQVTAEIIDYPEKKLFFKKPAKVKVSKIEEELNIKEIFATHSQNQEEKKQPSAPEKPIQTAQPKPQPRAEEKAVQPKAEKTAETAVIVEEKEIPESELSDKVKYAMEFLSSVIGQFYTGQYTLIPTKTESGCVIKIAGEDAGTLIGRKGETMEALSYLTSLAANRSDESFEKISVDVANYRQKREKDLRNNAKKIAIRVAKSGRPYTFEPMNPYDRRIIHAAVGEIEGVKSESKGEGSARRVMVMSTAPRKPRTNSDSSKGGYNKGGYSKGGYNKGDKKPYSRDRRDKPAAPAQKTRDEKLVDNAGTALYSKIEL